MKKLWEESIFNQAGGGAGLQRERKEQQENKKKHDAGDPRIKRKRKGGGTMNSFNFSERDWTSVLT